MIYLLLFFEFFKIGAFTFGGGYAMLPLIREAALHNGWMTEDAVVDFIAVSESTPGPLAINMATHVGYNVGGIFGSFFATLGVVLPSFIVILIVAGIYERFKKSRLVKGVMSGLKPCVVGLIAFAALTVAQTVFFPEGLAISVFSVPSFYISLALFLLCAVLAFKKVNPILIIVLSGAIGVLAGYTVL